MKDFVKRSLLALPSWRYLDILITIIFFWVAHRRLPLLHRELFNDYLFWVKSSKSLDQPLRQFVSDKELVKLFYRGIFLEDFAPRTLLCAHSFEEFASSDLPTRCVIKPAHLSGRVIFLDRIKRDLTSDELKEIRSWFSMNIYKDLSRERNYRYLKPSVICEEFIDDPETIKDYKIFCYKGEPRVIQVDVNRHNGHCRRLYTTKWSPLDLRYNKPLAPIEEKPPMLNEALRRARVIAQRFPFIRVDVYLTKDRVFLGELTSIPENAHGRFESREAEKNFMMIIRGELE